MSKKWIGVVSKMHVEKGVEDGFACVCHGKEKPISRLKAGDWLIYYSPTTTYPGGEKLQAFTAVGKVTTGEVYSFDIGADFKPFGLDMEYEAASVVPIADLKADLEFTSGRSWGMRLRAGLFEISEHDFALITAAMCKTALL